MENNDMKCPYYKPTPEQCFNCPLPDCYRDERQDESERVALYRKSHPDRVKKTRRNQYIKNQKKERAYQRKNYQKIKDNPEYKAYRADYNKAYKAKKKAEREKVEQCIKL